MLQILEHVTNALLISEQYFRVVKKLAGAPVIDEQGPENGKGVCTNYQECLGRLTMGSPVQAGSRLQ